MAMITRCVRTKIERSLLVFTEIIRSSPSKNLIHILQPGPVVSTVNITMANQQELLAVDLSGISFKVQQKHPKSVEYVKKISELLMNVGIPFENSDLIDSPLYTYPQMKNDDLYIAFILYFVWAFIVDDHLERYPQDFSRWLGILDGEECLGVGKVETFYRLFLKAANKGFATPKSLNECLRLTKDWLETFKKFELLNSGEISEEKLIEMRLKDINLISIFYFVHIDAGLQLTSELASDKNWDKLIHYAMLQQTIINDLFSLKKEAKAGLEKTNIVYAKMKTKNISAQEAVQQLSIEADNLDQLARYHGQQLKDAYGIKELDAYVDGLIASMNGNTYWSATCKRYNDI